MKLAWVERNTDEYEKDILEGVELCIKKGIQPVVTTTNNVGIYSNHLFSQCIGGQKSHRFMEHIDDYIGWSELLANLKIIAKRTKNKIVFVDAEATLKEYWSGEYVPNKYSLRTISNMLSESGLRVVISGVQMMPFDEYSNPSYWPTNKGWKICVALKEQAFSVGYYGWVNQKRRVAKYVHKLLSHGYDVYFCHAKRELHTNGRMFWSGEEVMLKHGPVLLYPGVIHWKETIDSL